MYIHIMCINIKISNYYITIMIDHLYIPALYLEPMTFASLN